MNKSLESAAKWMTLSVGIFIASGFFAVYTFMSRFHLRDHTTEFLRWKYIYVGVLCWLFPLALLLPMWGLFFLQKTLVERAKEQRLRKYKPGSVVRLGAKQVLASFFERPANEASLEQDFKEDVDGLSVLLVTAVPFVIYLTIELARPGVNFPLSCFSAIFFTFLALSALDIFRISAAIRRQARLGCALAVLVTLTVWGLHLLLFALQILTAGGVIYVFLSLSSAVIMVRTWNFGQSDRIDGKAFAQVTGISLAVLLMLVAVLSFGAFVYPYIPATRGGGDYTVQFDTLIQLKDNSTVCPPTVAEPTEQCHLAISSKRFKVIDSTGDSFFLADISTGGGPCAWREFPTTHADESKIPVVYEINKNEIAAMISEMPSQRDCSGYSNVAWGRIVGTIATIKGNIRGFSSNAIARAKLFCQRDRPLLFSYW